MLCQLALLLLLSSLQPGSMHEIDSESTAMSHYSGDWGKESGPLIEGVSSIQGHNIPKTSSRMAQAVLLRELSLCLLYWLSRFYYTSVFMFIDILCIWH